MVLGVADGQFRVLVTEVSLVDHGDGGPHGRFGIGVVDVGRDHLLYGDPSANADHRVVQVGPHRHRIGIDVGLDHGAAGGRVGSLAGQQPQ